MWSQPFKQKVAWWQPGVSGGLHGRDDLMSNKVLVWEQEEAPEMEKHGMTRSTLLMSLSTENGLNGHFTPCIFHHNKIDTQSRGF